MGSNDLELARLWGLRGSHDPQALEDLCLLIQQELHSFRPIEFSQLHGLDGLQSHSDRARQYVQDFLLDKVLTGKVNTTCEHVNALKVFYRRYLIDVIRSYRSRGKYLQDEFFGADDDAGSGLIEKTASLESTQNFDGLESLGIEVLNVQVSARQFLEQQEPWVRAFLSLSYCPNEDEGETMQALARRLRIRSYAYKAKKLGFNWRGESPEAFSETTLLGRWIVSLGIALTRENRDAVLDALKILCYESLLRGSEQEDVRP